jgi:hypothetical protein
MFFGLSVLLNRHFFIIKEVFSCLTLQQPVIKHLCDMNKKLR